MLQNECPQSWVRREEASADSNPVFGSGVPVPATCDLERGFELRVACGQDSGAVGDERFNHVDVTALARAAAATTTGTGTGNDSNRELQESVQGENEKETERRVCGGMVRDLKGFFRTPSGQHGARVSRPFRNSVGRYRRQLPQESGPPADYRKPRPSEEA